MKLLLFTLILISTCFIKVQVQGQSHYKYVLTEQEHQRIHKKNIKHEHDSDTPDPSEEARELKRRQKQAKHERSAEMLQKDKENVKYEKGRWKTDRTSGVYDATSKAGYKQHKRKLKEDKRRISSR